MRIGLQICIKQTQPPTNVSVTAYLKYGAHNCGKLHHLHMWQVTERQRDTEADGWMDSRGTVTDWTAYPVGTNSSTERAWEGKGKYVFTFQFGPHRFSIRWQMTRFKPCTLQISLSTALTSASLPSPSPLHLATGSSQFYPLPNCAAPPHTHIHTSSISLSACLPFQHRSSSQVC